MFITQEEMDEWGSLATSAYEEAKGKEDPCDGCGENPKLKDSILCEQCDSTCIDCGAPDAENGLCYRC